MGILFDREVQMKELIMPCGPRGAGKSTFCRKVAESDSRVQIVSRDQIMLEKFSTVYSGSYDGHHEYAMSELYRQAQEALASEATDRVILDCWTGEPGQRAWITRKMRRAGADYVSAWLFTTPLEVCVEQFAERESKPGGGFEHGFSRDSCRWDYRLFYRLASDLTEEYDRRYLPNEEEDEYLSPLEEREKQNRFDRVRFINPTQMTLPGLPVF